MDDSLFLLKKKEIKINIYSIFFYIVYIIDSRGDTF